LAVAGVAVAGGADFWAAALLANCAAGVVVGEFGCGKVSVERLRSVLSDSDVRTAPDPKTFIGA
jgi:bifunctional ADP-heptose synthase (sugar kinase/adenylyltransferase)